MFSLERILKIAVTVCLVCSSVFLMQASLINAKALIGQWLIESAWQKTLGTDQQHPPWPWADTYPVAQITIPRINKQLYVLQGASGEALAFGPGMNIYLNEANKIGVILIQAHRDTHFDFLTGLKPGDEIELQQAMSSQRFVVVEQQQVSKPSITLHDAEEEVLILSTCSTSPQQHSGMREVLIARRAS